MIKDLGRVYGARLFSLQLDGWAADVLGGNLQELKARFDCFLVNRSAGFDGADNTLVRTIVSRGVRWVEVFGCAAEEIHDAIDVASVNIGRQSAIGCGEPMTSWNQDMNDSSIGSYIMSGGQGDGDTKVVIVIGESTLLEYLTEALSAREKESNAPLRAIRTDD